MAASVDRMKTSGIKPDSTRQDVFALILFGADAGEVVQNAKPDCAIGRRSIPALVQGSRFTRFCLH